MLMSFSLARCGMRLSLLLFRMRALSCNSRATPSTWARLLLLAFSTASWDSLLSGDSVSICGGGEGVRDQTYKRPRQGRSEAANAYVTATP